MNARRFAAGITAGTAALALGAAGAAQAAVIANSPEVVPAVIVDPQGNSQVEPESIIITPADANNAVNFITWLVWNDNVAVGTGVEQINNCQPTCAEGTVFSTPVVIVLDDATEAEEGEDREFTEIRISGVQGERTLDLTSVEVLPLPVPEEDAPEDEAPVEEPEVTTPVEEPAVEEEAPAVEAPAEEAAAEGSADDAIAPEEEAAVTAAAEVEAAGGNLSPEQVQTIIEAAKAAAEAAASDADVDAEASVTVEGDDA
ncbi:hypothetical protein HT102_08470 [Hoyosella sp. G463]|uniref:Uncharacterized protein n=1 Tax=Lolliginicoccus lacisalsi TaxID=2742202 RepID=A0A927JDT1_9ACTN|nr:hypothetical protein [Lolliginicoccus lacisalsi]MBD8506517.1 hypothetical protein [Lolliginicoccus lacisalsi]